MTIRFAPWDDSPEFAKWKTDVRIVVEADDFARHVLWGQYAREGTGFWRRVKHQLPRSTDEVEHREGDDCRVHWEQGRAGCMAQVGKPLSGSGSKDVLTCVSLNVDTLDGVPTLFYHATSILVDHAAVEKFVKDTFVNARGRHHDAQNFHNAIHDIREIQGRR